MIFMDSGAFIALLVVDDQYHDAAVKYHKNAHKQRCTLDCIIAETYTHLRYRFGSAHSMSFIKAIANLRLTGDLKVEYTDNELAAMAEAILLQYADISLSYTDATALAWLRLHSDVQAVFGFDEHWRVEGHILVPIAGV